MSNTSTQETLPYPLQFSAAEPYPSPADGQIIHPLPMAQITFPDAQATVRFINAAMDEMYGTPLSTADFRSFSTAAIGKQSEYDASVQADAKTGQVHMTIRHPFNRSPEAHARLHAFVMDTIMGIDEA